MEMFVFAITIIIAVVVFVAVVLIIINPTLLDIKPKDTTAVSSFQTIRRGSIVCATIDSAQIERMVDRVLAEKYSA